MCLICVIKRSAVELGKQFSNPKKIRGHHTKKSMKFEFFSSDSFSIYVRANNYYHHSRTFDFLCFQHTLLQDQYDYWVCLSNNWLKQGTLSYIVQYHHLQSAQFELSLSLLTLLFSPYIRSIRQYSRHISNRGFIFILGTGEQLMI